MTYRVGNVAVTLNDLTPEAVHLIKAHPEMFRICLNNNVRGWLITTKKTVHLLCDVMTIYATLLNKVSHFDDITAMADKTRMFMTQLEEDLNTIFDRKLQLWKWDTLSFEGKIKKLAVLVLKSCHKSILEMSKCVSCVELFFLQFDNLKKLIVPCLMANIRMILRLFKKTAFYLELATNVDLINAISQDPTGLSSELLKIESTTDGIRCELQVLGTVFSTLDTSLQHYTDILLGKLILKRSIQEDERKIIKRRDVCYQAAEHVLSIPLTGEHHKLLCISDIKKQLLYLASLIVAFLAFVLYRFYKMILG